MKVDCSIIIPAYNVQDTIERCLSSILEYKCDNFSYEIIVINDGSTDSTLQLLKKYDKMKNVVIIDKTNGGVSSARNLGIERAQGEYLFFLDADDELNMQVLSQGVQNAKKINVQLAIFGYEIYDERLKNTSYSNIGLQEKELFSEQTIKSLARDLILLQREGLSSVWNKLFSKDFILSKNIKFYEDCSYGEDWIFCLKTYENLPRCIYYNEPIIRYFLDGTQGIDKYYKKLGSSLIIQYDEVKRVNDRLKILSLDDELKYLGTFLYGLRKFISIGKIKIKDKKQFLKHRTVKRAVSKALKLKLSELIKCGYSRRDKLWMLYIKLGFTKLAIKTICKKET